MDDTRPLDGLTGETGGYRQINQSDRLDNDLDGQGAAGYRRIRKRPPREDEETETKRRVRDRERPITDEPTPHLVQTLDRMRTTGESGSGTERLRKLRGQKHYRDDPTTAFHRRLGQAEQLAREARTDRYVKPAPSSASSEGALERLVDDALEPSDALERKKPLDDNGR